MEIEIQNLTEGEVFCFHADEDAPKYKFVEMGEGFRWYFSAIGSKEVRCSVRTKPVFFQSKN